MTVNLKGIDLGLTIRHRTSGGTRRREEQRKQRPSHSHDPRL